MQRDAGAWQVELAEALQTLARALAVDLEAAAADFFLGLQAVVAVIKGTADGDDKPGCASVSGLRCHIEHRCVWRGSQALHQVSFVWQEGVDHTQPFTAHGQQHASIAHTQAAHSGARQFQSANQSSFRRI